MSQTTFSGPVASQNGFIENSFTTAARDAIANPTVGLLIYNTTTNTYEVYNGTSWQAAFGPVVTGPTVVSITPNAGSTSGGNVAIITGTNFKSPATVRIGANVSSNVSVINTTAISAQVPLSGSIGLVNVNVSTVDGTGTLVNGFTYINGPTVSNTYPNVVAISGGTSVLIRGTSFAGPNVTVRFLDDTLSTYLTPTIINSTALSVVTPARGSGNQAIMYVINSLGTALTNTLPYVSEPVINSVSPNSGTSNGGTSVTLSGSNFYAPISVSFGSNASPSVTITNSNVAVAVAPAGTINTTVSVSVTSVGGTNTKSSAYSYVYVAPGYTNTQGLAFGNYPIAVNPTGTKLAAMNNSNVVTYTMSTAWDINTISPSSVTLLPSVSGKSYLNSCIAFNGDGTQMYTVVQDILYSDRYIVRFQLATPYDFSSYLAPGTAVMPSPIGSIGVAYPTSMFFSSDGLTGYIVAGGGGMSTIYQYSLSSAYNVSSFSNAAVNSVYISNLGGTPWGMNTPTLATMTPDGNYMLLASAGSTYNGQLFRIAMSTPNNVSTLSTTTANTYDYSAVSGGYGQYNGLTVGSGANNVLVSGPSGYLAKFVLG